MRKTSESRAEDIRQQRVKEQTIKETRSEGSDRHISDIQGREEIRRSRYQYRLRCHDFNVSKEPESNTAAKSRQIKSPLYMNLDNSLTSSVPRQLQSDSATY